MYSIGNETPYLLKKSKSTVIILLYRMKFEPGIQKARSNKYNKNNLSNCVIKLYYILRP